MDPNMAAVNKRSNPSARRRYDASRRREQAAHGREAILETARRLFLTNGYPSTTVAAIAEASKASVATIYKAFGGKSGLVRAIWERDAGDRVAPVARRDERRPSAGQSGSADPNAVIDQWEGLVGQFVPVAAPLLLLVRTAAASDPNLADLLETADSARLARMERDARDLRRRGLLRPGVSVREARDILWTYSSPDLYELLVNRQGWPIERYSRFVIGGMAATLLERGNAAPAVQA